ncbi:MAG: hypothetical protein AB7G17_09185 [Phycisphaerales bacterium]
MTNPSPKPHFDPLPSLLDDPALSAPAPTRRARKPFKLTLPSLTPKQSRALGITVGALGLLCGASIAYSALRPISVPDAQRARLPKILSFALLDADFNKLPVRERLELVLSLAKRMQGMNAGDSALVAAFAAGIRGQAREQLETNARTLASDLMADYGKQYTAIPDDQKEAFLESTAVEWSKLMEQLTGEERNVSDAERLSEMRDQAKRDAERGRQTDRRLTADRASNFMRMVQSDFSRYSSPNDRASSALFLRDMTRTLRGRDPATNEPKR